MEISIEDMVNEGNKEVFIFEVHKRKGCTSP